PESGEQQRAEQPFGNAEKPAGPADPEGRVQPEDQRAIADVRNQDLCLVLEPFLITKGQEDQHHRCANEVIVEVFGEQTRPCQDPDKGVHRSIPFMRWEPAPPWALPRQASGAEPPITLVEKVRPACARWQQAGRGGPVLGRHTGLSENVSRSRKSKYPNVVLIVASLR